VTKSNIHENHNFYLHKEYFRIHRYYGIYSLLRPVPVIRDPDLIKKVTAKWFEAFGNHRAFVPKDVDPIWAKNVFEENIEDGWHDLRTTLSPTLTSSKLKIMFELMQKCAKQCVKHFQKQEGLVTVETKDVFEVYSRRNWYNHLQCNLQFIREP
ncbi:hypothetical protein ILUMI_19255, partial [Ignelater luminosus]